MKGRVIVIEMPEDRGSKAALIVDGRLEDLLIDPPRGDTTPKPGEIYRAKVDRQTQGAAFVKLTADHQGFLRETKGIRQGQGLLVQVTSYAEPGKATPVTTRLLYKGRHVIVTPSAPGINISRQIKAPEERERLTTIAERASAAAGIEGLIVRSAGSGAAEDEIMGEIAAIRQRMDDNPETRLTAADVALLEWDAEPADPGTGFDHFGVWDEIERLSTPRADLPSGGWMAIEATRAMVTVDVNTGDGFGTGDAMTANIEAARELPRQLRLRGLGGQVIIDFAPLKKQHRKKIEETLKTAFRRDPVDTTLAGWTPLGNFELQRKRERRPLSELL